MVFLVNRRPNNSTRIGKFGILVRASNNRRGSLVEILYSNSRWNLKLRISTEIVLYQNHLEIACTRGHALHATVDSVRFTLCSRRRRQVHYNVVHKNWRTKKFLWPFNGPLCPPSVATVERLTTLECSKWPGTLVCHLSNRVRAPR